MPRKTPTWVVGDPLSATKVNKINEDLDDLYALWNDRLRVMRAASLTALKIDIWAGNFIVGSVIGQYAGWVDISVTNNATNYVMLKEDGTIQISTTAWNPLYLRLWVVTTSAGAITSIVDHRADVLGWPLWNVDIHGMTAKNPLALLDEFVISDSEASNVNKKVYMSTIWDLVTPMSMGSINWTSRYSDHPYFVCGVQYDTIYLNYSSWNQAYKNWNAQYITTSSLWWWTCSQWMIYGWRVYFPIMSWWNTLVYSCSINDNISIAWNWTLNFTITGQTLYIVWFDWTYLCFVQHYSNKIIYRRTTTWIAWTNVTLSSLPDILFYTTVVLPWKYICQVNWNDWYARDVNDNDINPYLWKLFNWVSPYFFARMNVLHFADGYNYRRFGIL